MIILSDRYPTVTDTDADIIYMAIVHELNKLPITFVPLSGAISEDQPNIAKINWGVNPPKVSRIQKDHELY